MLNPLFLKVNNKAIDDAFRIALGDFFGNIQPFVVESENRSLPCIMAGLDYDTPWTRDASFNSYYAASLIAPQIARNTLLAVLTKDDGGVRIGGQYWDAVIWVTAAWHHYLCTGDTSFLSTSFEAASNSMRHFEATECDSSDGLFRGGACFQDGVAAYPDLFADSPTSSILDWVKVHQAEKVPTGYGLPMKALSTNCLYYNAYCLLPKMARELNAAVCPEWTIRASRLREAIVRKFWRGDEGIFTYLVDAQDDRSRAEGLGHAFAVLFGVADDRQCESVVKNQFPTAHGIPCVWPPYGRYANAHGTSFGRHCGTIWPQVNAAWCMALCQCGRRDLAWLELKSLAAKACRDAQFAEIYHPITGDMYGGLQERAPGSIVEWESCRRQTWCATGYLQMVLAVLFGLRVTALGIEFDPWMPDGISAMSLSGIRYRDSVVSLFVNDGGDCPAVTVNGVKSDKAFIPARAQGPHAVGIALRS